MNKISRKKVLGVPGGIGTTTKKEEEKKTEEDREAPAREISLGNRSLGG